MKKILIVDDEPTLVATLKYNLERENWTKVATALDGEGALNEARCGAPDPIVRDLMLPRVSGLEVLPHPAQGESVPIPSVQREGRRDRQSRRAGDRRRTTSAVTKPFGMQELLARVRALLRRAETSPAAGAEVVRSGDLRVDLMRRECFRGETPLQLKPKEFDLLLFFLRNRGRAVTREQLLNQIWGYEFAGDTRTVDVHIRWLRQKIEEDPAVPRRLITVRGTGYRFEG